MGIAEGNIKVAVVGAGVTGLTVAQRLASKPGWTVAVFDKGRAVGGRTASRTGEANLAFDHGAQYFTARSDEFRSIVNDWMNEGFVARWRPRLAERDTTGLRAKSPDTGASPDRFVGQPLMRSIALRLAESLEVRRAEVGPVRRVHGQIRVEEGQGAPLGDFDAVAVTAPPLQTAQLVKDLSPRLAGQAETVEMAPTWAIMLAFEQPLELPYDGIFVNHGPLSWIARDSSKPGRPPGERFIVHASSEWSGAREADSPQDVLPQLESAFFEAVQLPPRAAVFSAAHRWKYALPREPLTKGCLVDADVRLVCGGDWTSGARIEGAWQTGTAMARALEGLLS